MAAMKRSADPEARPVIGLARAFAVSVVLWLALAVVVYLLVKA